MYRNECRECRKEKSRQWRADNPQAMSDQSRKSYLKWKYKISENNYTEMLASQDYKCAICECTQEENLGRRRLAIDHDHEDLQIRSLLCNNCNAGLGKFKDLSSLLRSAADYLDYHKANKKDS